MAINPSTQYPGKIAPPDANYPFGGARNISTPGDSTGTPWEAALVNDLFGFQQALLGAATPAIVPSGSPETAIASQYLEALNSVIQNTGEWVVSRAATFVSSTSYTVVGDHTAQYTIGRRVRLNDSSFVFGEVTNSVFATGNTTVTVSMDAAFVLTGSLTTSEVNVIAAIRGIQPIGLAIPRNANDSFDRPILNFNMGASLDINFWANPFAQNFILGGGGSSLNNGASGSKDGSNVTSFGFGNFLVATETYASDAFGFNSCNVVTTGDSICAYGYQTASRATTAKNIACFGTDAGFNITTARDIVCVGRHTLFDGTGATDFIGSDSIFIGTDIALFATDINDCVYIGDNTGLNALISTSCNIIGSAAARDAEAPDQSNIMGATACQTVATLLEVVTIGDRAVQNSLSDTQSVSVGADAFFTSTGANQVNSLNTGVGFAVGIQTWGIENTFIGSRSGGNSALTQVNGAVCIGYRSGHDTVADNDLIIANGEAPADELIRGNFGTKLLQLEGTAFSMKNLPVVGTGASGTWWNDSNTVKIVP